MTEDAAPPPRRQWLDLYRIGPARADHRPALRIALSIAIPLLILNALGRLDLGVYATFGAMTSVYGRGTAYRERAGIQLTAGAALTGAVLVGACVSLLPHSAIWIVIFGSTVAGLGSCLASSLRWVPPGPFFLVFAFTVSAAVPSIAARLPLAFLLPALSATLAVIRLFAVEGVHRSARRSQVEGRGLPMMGVLTLPDRKTSTWLTLLFRPLI